MVNYNKRLVEVDEILNYLEKTDYEKIPKEIIQSIKDNKDKSYVWKYDLSKELKDQNVSRDTIAILSYLNMEYLLNEEQKQLMQQIHQFNQQKIEQEQLTQDNKELFPPTPIINKNNTDTNTQIEVYKEKFFSKLLKMIKKVFKR